MDIVTPDDVWRSSIYDRMNVVSPTIQMPPLARNLVDTNAVQVMADWINSLPGTPALAPPAISPNGGTFTGPALVTLQPPDTNATVFYTLDGSLPTTSSLPYSAPFTLTNTATVSANAFEAGYTNSVAASALFVIQPGLAFTGSFGFSNGAFLAEMTGLTGKTYVFQSSTDLVSWISLGTNTPAGSPFYFTDSTASNAPYRFYRAIQEP
jgi:hypothetical protein